MEKQALQQKKTSQTSKAKKKPLKVVYISNPMKVKADATEFRALVQELTGRDADPSKYAAIEDGNDFTITPLQIAASQASSSKEAQPGTVMEGVFCRDGDGTSSIIDQDISTPEMIDNFSAFSPSTMLYDLHDYCHDKI